MDPTPIPPPAPPAPQAAALPAVGGRMEKLEVSTQSRPVALRAVMALLVLAVLQASAVMGVNVAVDPRDEFGVDWLPPAVPDEVHLQLDLYEATDPTPRHVVLGSSRARLFDGLPDQRNETYNMALHGGTVLDEQLMFSYLVRTGNAPESAIVVLDQMAFTEAYPSRVLASPDSGRVTGHQPTFLDSLAKVLATYNTGYLEDSARSLQYAYATGYPPLGTFGETTANPAFAPPDLMDRYLNGTFDPAGVRPSIDRQMVASLGPSATYGPDRRAAFDLLVEQARASNTALYVVMPPIQPVALADYERRFPDLAERFGELRDALLDACGPGVHTFDYTDVETFGGDGREFLDQTHQTQVNDRLMEEAMAAGVADLCAPPQGQSVQGGLERS